VKPVFVLSFCVPFFPSFLNPHLLSSQLIKIGKYLTMRNPTNEESSVSSWTIPSTIDTESFDRRGAPPAPTSKETTMLEVYILPRHDCIGLHVTQSTTHVCINVKAADVDDEKRASVDITVALDVSGSMSGRRIEDCKITLQLMVRSLTSSDHFGLHTLNVLKSHFQHVK
jgi:hypothetical protein